ncbi:MAG: transcription termination/antitermination protein NusG [Tissierellia bacterium]|nr:transcription termination/antitermination protein NusG [Tissierellia bacterium]
MTEQDKTAKKDLEDQAQWFVIHTYSGHENKVKFNLDSMVKNMALEDLIFDVQVPMEEVVEEKEGVTKVKERKMFPSYVLVKMIMNDRTWYLVRNTRGVTGFVGPGSKPIPLSENEVRMLGVATKEEVLNDFNVGDRVKVLAGPFKDFVGTVKGLDYDKGTVNVIISMFGRDTNIELEFNHIIQA